MTKKRFAKVFACLLAVTVAGGVYASLGGDADIVALETSAAAAKYNMTNEYRSGRFYKNLTSLSLSGDGARDTVAIAMSQVGYHEGDGESDFDGETNTGTKDFVEYNVLYGKLDNNQGNGMSYGYYWCASFVNWCLRQAGVPESATAGVEVSCQRWFADCKAEGIYRSKGGYIPKLGDIIFFKDKGSAVDSTHVGLVRYSDGNYVYTVEGNTSNGSEYSSNGEYVALKSHKLSSSYIVGYATPKYGENKTLRRVDYSGGFYSIGDYISEGEIEIYSDEALTVKQNKSIPAFSLFKVTKLDKNHVKITYDGAEGYISPENHLIQITTTESIYIINYVNEDGAQMYMPQYRHAGQAKDAYANTPSRDECGFVGWSPSCAPDTVVAAGGSLPEYDGDITLKAVWDPDIYTVCFKNSDGAVFYQTSGYYGTQYDIPAPPAAPDGYVFFGWGAEPSGKITGNVTYTATFLTEEEFNAAMSTETETSPETNTHAQSGCNSSAGFTSLLALAIIPITLIPKKKK